jgi:CheY-like chemotaxis protein
VTEPLHAGRILLVDDSSADIELTLEAFEGVEFSGAVRVARSGAEAVEQLTRGAAREDGTRHPLPDLILLDLKMPGVDGFEVLRAIKSCPGVRQIPVVVLTSSREQADVRLCYEGGANSYLVKPLAFAEFQDVVRSICDYWLALNVPPPEQGLS